MSSSKFSKNRRKIIIYGFAIALVQSSWSYRSFAASLPEYSPIFEVSATASKSRSISELNFMLPFWQSVDSLPIFDIKVKNDDKRSAEYNLGLVYRHNFKDQAIFGVYNYFDRRKTSNDLLVNQWTGGIEFLSHYLDGRFNIYIPQKKKKLLEPGRTELVRVNNRIYGLQSDDVFEQSLPGYDVEVGVPLFGLMPSWDQKLGTRIYAAKYHFAKSGVAKHSGLRLRLEQKIAEDLWNNNGSEFSLFLGSDHRSGKKWYNFAGFSLRLPIGKNSGRTPKTYLQKRMMAPVVRDVDIITSRSRKIEREVPVFFNDKEVKNIYFVGDCSDEDYEGNGTYEKPFSKAQLIKLRESKKFNKQDVDLILPVRMDKDLGEYEYQELLCECLAFDIMNAETSALKAEKELLEIKSYFPNSYRFNYVPEIEFMENNDSSFVIKNIRRVELDTVLDQVIQTQDANSEFNIDALAEDTPTNLGMLVSPVKRKIVGDNLPHTPRTQAYLNVINNVNMQNIAAIRENVTVTLSPSKKKNPPKKPANLTPRSNLWFNATFNVTGNALRNLRNNLQNNRRNNNNPPANRALNFDDL